MTINQAVEKIFRGLVTLILLVVTVILSFALVRTAGIVPTDSKIISVNNTPDYAMGGIQGESILQQSFKTDVPVDKIGIKFATYDRENPGEIYLRVFNVKTEVTLAQSVKSAKDLVDNDFNIFVLDQEIPGDGQTYVMEVTGSSPNVIQSAGVWCSYASTYPDGVLTVNEFKTDGDLVFFLSSPTPQDLFGPVFSTIGLVLLLLALLIGWLLFTRHENRRHS